MAKKRKWAGTPAQRAALRKAQLASVKARRWRAANRNHGKAPTKENRGIGIAGLRVNFVPYVRVNKRSQTVGYNAGAYVRGTNSRVVTGQYIRRENATKKNNAVDRTLRKAGLAIAPMNTRRRRASNFVKKNVTVTNPAVRAAIGGAEVRLATSRGAGPTIVVRRGKHKVSRQASVRAIKRYDTNARKLNAKRQGTPRPQRRKANKNG